MTAEPVARLSSAQRSYRVLVCLHDQHSPKHQQCACGQPEAEVRLALRLELRPLALPAAMARSIAWVIAPTTTTASGAERPPGAETLEIADWKTRGGERAVG